MNATHPTVPIWQSIRDALGTDIRAGRPGPGQRLPTEPALMARFAAGRHSVRRALAELEADGLVRTLQGSGSFVREAPVLDYRLSERTRFSQNLLAQGREPSGVPLFEEEAVASPEVTETLRLPPGEPVYHVLRLGLADEVPIHLSSSHYPVRRFPGMLNARHARGSVSDVLASYGVADYVRLRSLVTTRLPTLREARLLEQPRTEPVLVVRKVDVDLAGVPVSCSETVWAGGRVQLSVDNSQHLGRSPTPQGGGSGEAPMGVGSDPGSADARDHAAPTGAGSNVALQRADEGASHVAD